MGQLGLRAYSGYEAIAMQPMANTHSITPRHAPWGPVGCATMVVWAGAAAAAEPSLWPALQTKPVSLVANDWCPQHCENSKPHKGYVVDIVSQALALEGVPFNLRYVPWSRAMLMVERGEADGVLTPTVPSFPKFYYHEQAVGYQQYCFYVNAASPWKYQQYSDLKGKRIALLADSGLGALDDYLKANKSSISVHEMVGEHDYAVRLFTFLALKRTDTVVITTDVFDYNQSRGTLAKGFKSAGCLASEKMALGLSRTDLQRSRLIGQAIDSGIVKLRKSGELAQLLAAYGMVDWAPNPNPKRNGSAHPATAH